MWQLTPWDCVPACCVAALRRFNVRARVGDLSRQLGAWPDGVRLRDAAKLLRTRYRLRVRRVRKRDIFDALRHGGVVLTSLTYKHHAVLVTKRDGQMIRIHDPNPLTTFLPWRRRVPLDDVTDGYVVEAW